MPPARPQQRIGGAERVRGFVLQAQDEFAVESAGLGHCGGSVPSGERQRGAPGEVSKRGAEPGAKRGVICVGEEL